LAVNQPLTQTAQKKDKRLLHSQSEKAELFSDDSFGSFSTKEKGQENFMNSLQKQKATLFKNGFLNFLKKII
jgi:hypothetical protein